MDIDKELDKFDGPAQEGGNFSEPQPFEVKITLVGSINEALGPFFGGKAEDGNAAGTALMALNTMINHAPCSRYPSKKTSSFPPSAQQPRMSAVEATAGSGRRSRRARSAAILSRMLISVLMALQVDAVEVRVI
jgi:hypothetical protein